mmetsp:Transcript_28616/g.63487  ORF Transcript_28616/g.63487 Transcript_28616/m.63487 type:complete len:201 (-) Transcript_28616:1641-2243(-)
MTLADSWCLNDPTHLSSEVCRLSPGSCRQVASILPSAHSILATCWGMSAPSEWGLARFSSSTSFSSLSMVSHSACISERPYMVLDSVWSVSGLDWAVSMMCLDMSGGSSLHLAPSRPREYMVQARHRQPIEDKLVAPSSTAVCSLSDMVSHLASIFASPCRLEHTSCSFMAELTLQKLSVIASTAAGGRRWKSARSSPRP